MDKKLNLYKCDTCGNIAETVIEGMGALVCCGKDMKLIEIKKEDELKEKHVPVIEHMGTSHVIKIGQYTHPMDEKHYIEFIEAISKDKRYIKRKYLNPDEEPEMILKGVDNTDFKARAYCNIHGLYESKEE